MSHRYQAISAAGHLEAPLELWSERVPAAHRLKLPSLVTGEDDTERWHLLNQQLDPSTFLVAESGRGKFELARTRKYRQLNGSLQPGCGDAVQRLREQDEDGVDAEVLFPPLYLGTFLRPLIKQDPEAYLAIVKTYNTFLAQDYCAVAPDRLIGCAMLPEIGTEGSLEELERCRKMGLHAMALTAWPNGSELYQLEDDRFFLRAMELEVQLTARRSFGGPDPRLVDAAGTGTTRLSVVTMANASLGTCPEPVSQGILHGLFDRIPKLKFYFAETQAGWLPFYFQQTDEFYQRWYPYHNIMLKKIPSQYYRDHCMFSFNIDEHAVRYRHHMGLDILMWTSSFPLSDGSAPHSRQVIEKMFHGIPATDRNRILMENACEYFGLDMDKELTPTP